MRSRFDCGLCTLRSYIVQGALLSKDFNRMDIIFPVLTDSGLVCDLWR